MQGARRRPWWLPRASRATPQTPQRTEPPAPPNTMVALEQSALPTLRDRADFPSCGVVASSLGVGPTSSAPPCLRGNLPRSRPREILRQAPWLLAMTASVGARLFASGDSAGQTPAQAELWEQQRAQALADGEEKAAHRSPGRGAGRAE